MFGADVLVIETLRFLIRELHHFSSTVGESVVHVCGFGYVIQFDSGYSPSVR